MRFATLCLLSFERHNFLVKSLNSLKENTKFPYELIVHDDGSLDKPVRGELFERLTKGEISFLVLNGGKNMGVGSAMQRCAKMAHGDWIFKVDADLEYREGWLEKSVGILENNPDVACVGQFNYRNYAPNDNRFNILETRKNCHIVDDFVNSIYGFKKEVFEKHGDIMGDDGWQKELVEKFGYKSAIILEDMVHNFGFGLNSSIYMNKDGGTRAKSLLPLLFNAESNS